MRILSRISRVACACALLAVLRIPALQGQAVNGTILGTVTDPSGAAVVGATVEVTNTATQVKRSVVTNTQGRYRVPELIIGTYDVRVSFQGFETSLQTGIPVVVGG